MLKDELVLTKIDVGRRQLNTAVRMFFFEEDVVSLHTVAAAAHGVLRDVARYKGINKSLKDSPLISESERSKYIAAVNYPQNFFKHATKDANGKMVFRYQGNILFLLDAIVLYTLLDEELTREMKIFLMWFQLRFPDVLCYQPAEEYCAQIRSSTPNPVAFKTLAKVLLQQE